MQSSHQNGVVKAMATATESTAKFLPMGRCRGARRVVGCDVWLFSKGDAGKKDSIFPVCTSFDSPLPHECDLLIGL